MPSNRLCGHRARARRGRMCTCVCVYLQFPCRVLVQIPLFTFMDFT